MSEDKSWKFSGKPGFGFKPPTSGDGKGKFTERAQKVLTYAEEEARRFNHNYIGTEHIVIALTRETGGIAAKALAGYGVDEARAREAVAFVVGRGDRPPDASIKLTPRAKRVVRFAMHQAKMLNHSFIGTEHLLLASFDPDDEQINTGVGFALHQHLGFDPKELRERMLALLASNNTATRPRDNVVTCRVDDRTLAALDALVETGVHSTRSEAAARLLAAGMAANRPLLDKVFAAVAEIHRVQEETRSLAQQWQAAPPAAERNAAPDTIGTDETKVTGPTDDTAATGKTGTAPAA